MGISPILANSVIQRADDVALLKNQQDTRPAVEQQNAQAQVEKKVQEQHRQVIASEENQQTDTHADAREKGKNAYFRRKKINKEAEKEAPKDGVVVKKTTGGFDIKI